MWLDPPEEDQDDGEIDTPLEIDAPTTMAVADCVVALNETSGARRLWSHRWRDLGKWERRAARTRPGPTP